MDSSGIDAYPTVPDRGARAAARPSRSAAAWVGLAFLALAVLATGIFMSVLGPLLAIACNTCQDGVRGSLQFGSALLALARFLVPLTTLGTVVGIFLPRGGARAGGIGLGLLVLLLFAMLALGQFTG